MKVDPTTLAFLLESMGDSVREIRQLCTDEVSKPELQQMARVAHKLKGEATVVGMANLSQRISQFEDLLVRLQRQPALASVQRRQILGYLSHISEVAQRIRSHTVAAPSRKSASKVKPLKSASGFAASLQVLAGNICRSDGKHVALNLDNFNVSGIPHALQVKIQDMVMQLVRNAIAHGIELPDARQQQGKTPLGHVVVVVRREQHQILVAVQDDGAGINLEHIRRRLIFKYGVSVRKAAELSREQLLNALYLPGFSTLNTQQNHAGRGVGLDLVKAYTRELDGKLTVDFKPGRFTRFVMRLPAAERLPASGAKVVVLRKPAARPAAKKIPTLRSRNA